MYKFYYKYTGRKNNNHAKLLLTDSLVYEIETGDVSEDFYENKSLFDFSYCPEDSKLFDLINKKVFVKVKNGSKKKVISEFIGLKSKMYSLITVGSVEIKKLKEVNKNIIKNIRHKE